MSSIRKLPSGKYQAQIRPVSGGKQLTKTSTKRYVVEQWLNEQTAALVTGTFTHPRAGRETFASYYAEWAQRQVWESNTTQTMAITVKYASFRDSPLKSITRAHIEQWVKLIQKGTGTARGKPLAPGTMAARLQVARTIFRAAVAEKKIPSDPTMGVKLPRLRKAEASMRIPTSAQVGAWLDHSEPHWRALIALCAFGGMRLGEASALQVGDIDFLKRTIKIQRQVQRKGAEGGRPEIRLPKYGSERAIAAANGLLSELSKHIALLGLQGQPDAWLFTTGNGQPAHPNTVGYAWVQSRDAAKLTGFTLHDLRHFYASGLIAAGCDISTVQHALGHSKPSITLDTYTHLWPKAEDRTRAAAQGMIDAVLNPADESVTNETLRSPQTRG